MSERDDLGKTLLSSVPAANAGQQPVEPAAPAPAPNGPRYSVPEGVADAELGRGGMGRVLRLFDTHLGREVAVKELLGKHRDDALVEALFVREAHVLAKLEHPGIVPVYEIGRRPDGTPFYAMRRIRGDSLEKVLGACATLDDRLLLLSHYLTVVQTMGFAHSRHVVHRDLKPENVMVSRFGETLVIDWGLAVVDGQMPEGLAAAGTPTFMAPEQAAGERLDARADVWSLGVMLYELLTGKLPFEGDSATSIMNAVLNTTAPPIRSLEPKAPPALVAVAERAMQKSPSGRYANAGDMAEALESAMRTRVSTTRGPVIVAAALAGALLLSLVWGFMQAPRVENARRDARLAVDDAERARNDALADSALRALRDRDTLTADKLAAVASTHPLARGVDLLAREAGVPARQWTVQTEAGCSSIAVVDDLAACGTLNEVQLYRLSDGAPAGRLSTGPRGWQQGLAALPNHRLATAGDDRIVRVFDVVTKKLLSEANPMLESVTALAADGDAVYVGLRSGAVIATATGEEVHHHSRPVMQLVASHGVVASTSGSSLEVTRHDGTSTLDRRAGALAFSGDSLLLGVERSVALVNEAGSSATFGAHHHNVTAVAVFASGASVSGSADGELRWWNKDGLLEATSAIFTNDIRVLQVFGDQVLVASGRALEAWAFVAPRGPVWDDAPTAQWVSASRPEVLAGFRDGRLRRFELNGTSPSSPLELRHTAPVRALTEVGGAERPEGFRVLSGGDDGKVLAQRWNGEVDVLAAEAGTRVLAVAASPDGERAAWALDDGTVALYSLKFEKEISKTRGTLTRALAFSADGTQLAVGRDDKRVAVLKAETGALEKESDAFDAEVTALVWSAPSVVAVGRVDGAVSDWNIATNQREHQWVGASSRVNSLAASGNRLAAGTHDGQGWVWNLERSGAADFRVPADASEVGAVGFAGDALVLTGTDGLVHVLGR